MSRFANWSDQEDRLIIAARELGRTWVQMADEYFDGRSPEAIRSRHRYLITLGKHNFINVPRSVSAQAAAATKKRRRKWETLTDKAACAELLRLQVMTGQHNLSADRAAVLLRRYDRAA